MTNTKQEEESKGSANARPDKPRAARLGVEEMGERLVGFVAEQRGVDASSVRVRDLRRLAGGASRLLWSLDVEIGAGGPSPEILELVLRQDPPGRVQAGGMELEFELLKAAQSQGVAVPAVHWCEPSGQLIGAPFFIMQRLVAEAIPRRLLRDEKYAKTREVMLGQLGEILAGIHRIDPTSQALAGRLSQPDAGSNPAASELDKLVGGYRLLAVEPHPVLDLAERWLRENIPAAPPLRLVHGDYRVGNFMFDERGVVAVLDWELAHVGDPVEDLAWVCVRAWRFGNDAQAAGGLGTREELVSAYEAAGGTSPEPGALRFWEMMGNFKLALVFITQARAYLDGAHATVELASLGRRTAEGEQELLRLMEDES